MGVQSTLFLLNTTTTFIHSPPQSEYLWGNPDYISTDNLTRKQKGHPVYGSRVSEERVGVRIMGHGGQRGGGGEGGRGK